jgi:hypothetical protein
MTAAAEVQMFRRMSFIVGLAIGYVLGAQAGRERYEQIKQMAQKAWEHPTTQQAAGAVQAQGPALAKNARDKAMVGMRQGATQMRKHASKVTHRSSGSDDEVGTTSTMTHNGAMPPPRTGDDPDRPFRTT